jgi:hypothetical protein
MRALLATALCSGLLASPVAAQFAPPPSAHAVMSSAKWTGASGATAIAASNVTNSTVTIDLLPATQIQSHIFVNIEAAFNTSKGTYHPMIPVHSSMPNNMTCESIAAGNVGSSKKRTTSCKITNTAIKALTANATYTATVAGNGGNKVLTVVLRPYAGPNYLSGAPTLVSTGNRPNDLITFRIRLSSPVPTGQSQVVAWGLTPRECFAQANPGATYNATWTLNAPNRITFSAGEQQRDVTVRIASSNACVGANRKFEAWHPDNTNVLTAPTYQFRFFTINAPL